MKIIVIGHPCIDIFHKGSVELSEQIGGISYSLAAFYLNFNASDKMLPRFFLNQKDKIFFNDFFQYINLDQSLVYINNKTLNRVHLFIEKATSSMECYQEKAEKIDVYSIPDIYFETYDFYINMISGFDLELDDLKYIRSRTKNKIYLDIHTLIKSIDERGKRFNRPLDNWLEWIDCCDIIQVNENERVILPPEQLNEDSFIRKCFSTNCQIVNLTKGSNGATTAIKKSTGYSLLSEIPSPISKKISTVGCGDIFGATYFYEFLKTNNNSIALKKAVMAATNKIEYSTITEIIENKDRIINEHK